MVRNVSQLLEILALLYCFSAVYARKLKCSIYMVLFIIAEMVLMMGINEYGAPKTLSSFSYVFIVLFCLLDYKENVKRTVINCMISVMVVGVIQLVVYFMITMVYSDTMDIYDYTHELLVAIISMVLVIVLANKLRLSCLSDFMMKNNIVAILVTIFLFGVLINAIFQMKSTGFLNGENCFSFIYFILAMALLMLEWQQSREEAEKRKVQLEMNTLYYSTYESLIQSIREKQHDIKNHINTLTGMIYTINDYDSLVREQKKYLGNMLEKQEDVTIVSLVENPLIAGFLIKTIKDIQMAGIHCEYNLNFVKRELKVSEYTLIEMMGILIDNAMEATKGQPIGWIMINMSQSDGIFTFTVLNTCKESNSIETKRFFENGYSTKGNHRGIGLYKLKRTVLQKKGQIITGNEILDTDVAVKIGFEVPV